MVDNLGSPDSPSMAPVDAQPDLVEEKPAGFLSSTAGKLVVGGIAVIVVLGALAAIAFFFFIGRTSDEVEPVVTTPTVETSGTASANTSETAEPRPEQSPEDLFTARNVFEPTVKLTVASDSDSDGDGGGTSDGGTPDVPADTLYLAGVSTVDGEPVAELIWNGETYSLGEGESIPGTPWKVLSISGDTVVMLYGDSRVTLTVGQGLSK